MHKVARKCSILVPARCRPQLGGCRPLSSMQPHLPSTRTVSDDALTLWHCKDARSLRCLWTMEELGLEGYTLVTMPFPPRFFHREYLKTNVLGTIPYLKIGDVAMTESCGICQFLVSKYGPTSLAVSPHDPDYATYLNFLHQADATLTFPQTIVLRYTVLEPGKCDAAADDYGKWFLARLRLLDNTLADGREFLVGNRFTIADICVGYALYLSQAFGLKLSTGESLSEQYTTQTKQYLLRLLERPALKKCLQIQDDSLKEFNLSMRYENEKKNVK